MTTHMQERPGQAQGRGKRLALRREMTFGEIFRRFPQARLLAMRGLEDINPVRDAELTVGEYAQRFGYGWAFETSLGTLNNCLVLLENADQVIEGDPALVDYALFHGLHDLPSPETTRRVVPVHMDEARLGLVCDGGLPYLRWVLSDGLNAVQLHEEGPAVEMLTCFQRVAGMSCERIFDGGFLDLQVEGERHRFDQVHLRSYGYENHSRSRPEERSSLLMYGDRMWLSLAAPGQQVQWVLDDATMVTTTAPSARRQVLRHGWDEEARCLLFTTIDDRPSLVGVRPQAFDGFADEEILGFLGTEWPETMQGARPMHTEAWVAVGPDKATEYAGREGSLHTFSVQGGGCLMLGLGSTRAGALAELQAAREGQAGPRRRQERRYAAVAQRAPRLQVEGRPLAEELAALIPPFLESLKTGFVLMRSRPHTGAVCGGWDQLMIASPMVRAGDYDMTPRYLEHWLHQVALDGQIFHVSDVDLGPAVLFRRWDMDDFLYLIVAAQWIAHCDDGETLERLSAKCTHMLRVMLDQVEPETGLIAARGIFPDWPPLESARTGITCPALENGLWYEALRWWEGLTLRLGETALSARVQAAARRLQSRFAELFLDSETGMIWDAVRLGTHEAVRTSAVWSLTPFQGSFGHELFSEEQLERLARHIASAHLDLRFPVVQSMVGYEIPCALEHIHWPAFDHMVAKALRRGRSESGMHDLLEIIERQYQWRHTATEAVNAYNDLKHDLHSQYAFWFGWSATGWYETLLSGLVGLWEEPGGLVYVCSEQSEEIRLTGLPYRRGRWDVHLTGSGRYVDLFEVDGKPLPGVCKLPQGSLTPGSHRLRIRRADSPPGPLVLDSVGLSLIDSSRQGDALRVKLAGPGRAVVRFYSEHRPVVRDGGQSVPVQWEAETGLGRCEICRAAQGEDLVIGTA